MAYIVPPKPLYWHVYFVGEAALLWKLCFLHAESGDWSEAVRKTYPEYGIASISPAYVTRLDATSMSLLDTLLGKQVAILKVRLCLMCTMNPQEIKPTDIDRWLDKNYLLLPTSKEDMKKLLDRYPPVRESWFTLMSKQGTVVTEPVELIEGGLLTKFVRMVASAYEPQGRTPTFIDNMVSLSLSVPTLALILSINFLSIVNNFLGRLGWKLAGYAVAFFEIAFLK